MVLLLIGIGWILLRSVASWLFYAIGIAFSLFLFLGIYSSIKEKEWQESLYAILFLILILYIMVKV